MRTVGNYRLRSLVGRGATSEVYTAEHVLLGDVVAVKLLRPELADDSTQALALIDEGTRLRTIDHPNVVRVLDAGLDPENHGCYLVMEHVAGETLSARLRREGPLPEAEVRRLGAELADGVAAAHARGIVHRDLKPANVMLDGTRPKIVDFGIAKHLGARSAVTTGRVVGTLAYMAPEQLTSGLIAACTDVWALGVILFEVLCGRHPFDNFNDGRCPQLFDTPARASSVITVSPELDAILARCLERDPARRIGSAAELARLLRGEVALDDERITADAGPLVDLGPPTIGEPLVDHAAPTIAEPRRTRTWMLAAAALVLVGGTIVTALAMRDERSSSATTTTTTTAPSVTTSSPTTTTTTPSVTTSSSATTTTSPTTTTTPSSTNPSPTATTTSPTTTTTPSSTNPSPTATTTSPTTTTTSSMTTRTSPPTTAPPGAAASPPKRSPTRPKRKPPRRETLD